MDVSRLLQERTDRHGTKPALVFKDRTITFGGLESEVRRLAGALRDLGVGPGTKLGIYLPNGPECVVGYLAGFMRGAVVVPLDYGLSEDELSSCLNHAGCTVLIARPRPALPSAVLRRTTNLRALITVAADEDRAGEGVLAYETLRPRTAEDAAVPVDPEAPALIMYTSGTTGRPKGILLTYRHLDGSPEAMKHFVDLSGRDVKLAAIPLTHVAGLIYIQNCLIFGITLILMERFHPLEFLRLVERHRVTCFHLVPAMYTALLSLKRLDRFDLSSLRWVVVFGAPSSPETLDRFRRYCPNARLLNGWGMTETCPPNTVTPLGSDNIASVGRPSPLCEIRVVDEEGGVLPPGGIGEVVLRGWVVMRGYYRDPETTSEVLRDGWLHTGDLGRFDADGFLYIVGRKKDMIKVAGQIVYAAEVEAVLCRHEAVAEAAVIGVPDPLRGEVVKAFVVPIPGRDVSAEEVRHYARGRLAHFKVPQSVEIRDDLPRNRTGKTDKEALRRAAVAAAV